MRSQFAIRRIALLGTGTDVARLLDDIFLDSSPGWRVGSPQLQDDQQLLRSGIRGESEAWLIGVPRFYNSPRCSFARGGRP